MALLPVCVRKDRHPQYTFNKAIIEATRDYAACYKPNLAFYLSAGTKGLEALKLTIEAVPEDIPVIIDCKAGDIGNTMQAYVNAFFEEMGADAITVNPLMGKEVILPVFEDDKNFAFALALTSNPSAKEFLLNMGLYQEIAAWITHYNPKQLGAVVGATQTEHLKQMRILMPEHIFLIPGIGAQGGDLEAVLTNAIKSPKEPDILINSSRGIIFKDKTTAFADVAAKETLALRDRIGEFIAQSQD
jgi:orotidine-5'-phosphate decarboxylase